MKKAIQQKLRLNVAHGINLDGGEEKFLKKIIIIYNLLEPNVIYIMFSNFIKTM